MNRVTTICLLLMVWKHDCVIIQYSPVSKVHSGEFSNVTMSLFGEAKGHRIAPVELKHVVLKEGRKYFI